MTQRLLDAIVVGAGPAGISVAAEAIVSGVRSQDIVVLEKAKAHSYSIRKLYPEEKLVAANYKGIDPVCHGVVCIPDMSKTETLSFLDKVIEDYGIDVKYKQTVHGIKKEGDLFIVETDTETFRAKICVIAIGIFGRPNKPDYKIPGEVRTKVHFDITSQEISNKKVLVVGGGDSASEYVQFLVE